MEVDASIVDLMNRIKQTYELIQEYNQPSKFNAMKNVLVDIAQVITECAQFIRKYWETKSFCELIISAYLSSVSSYR